MARRLSGVFGFVTNSSSAILHFPSAILDHPEIKHFMEIYGLSTGYIGDNLWNRQQCETLAFGSNQKQEVARRLRADSYADDDEKYYGPSVDAEAEGGLLIYGDEYPGLTSTLSDMIRNAADELNLSVSWDDYN